MAIVNTQPGSLAPWMSATRNLAAAATRVREWWERADRAYPETTKKAWRCDWTSFIRFCEATNSVPLPASPDLVASFVNSCRLDGRKPATIRRYLSTIALAHRVAKLDNPCADEFVQLEIKSMYKQMHARQRQAMALTWQHIKKFNDTAGEGIRPDRERALLCVAYDTLARRAELVALNVEDVSFLPDGTGRALIRRSKTDQIGEGTVTYLSRDTVRRLAVWLERANIVNGAIFRRLVGRHETGDRLNVDGVAHAFKRVATFIGMSVEEVRQVSGHSLRVGATQDLLALNIDLASVMQAGRWKSNRMPMRYGEHVLAARGGIARAASVQGRDS